MKIVSWLGLVLSIYCAPNIFAAEPSRVEPLTATKQTMHEIFAAMKELLPLSLNSEAFDSPANDKKILGALQQLSKNAGKLGTHAAPLNNDYSFAGRSLARDAAAIESKFARGRKDEARYLLGHISEACITCHSKMPEKTAFHAGDLFEKGQLRDLDIYETASMQTAMRQFTNAIQTYESIIGDKNIPVADMILHGVVTDYLILVLRVKYEPKRAEAVLAALQARADTPQFLKLDLAAWRQSLKQLPSVPANKHLLAKARQTINDAQRRAEYPLDDRNFVDYVYASRLLHEVLNAAKSPSPQVAEAYYYLGLTETVIARSFWLSETEFYLETSIRMAPRSPFAMNAYSLLEEHALLEYSGSSGIHLPADVKANLGQLYELITK